MTKLYLSQEDIHNYFNQNSDKSSLIGGGLDDLEDPYELIFKHGHKRKVKIDDKSVILQPHQIIPQLYFTCQTNKLILNYGMGSGKTLAAVYVLYYYHNLNKLNNILHSDDKKQDYLYNLYIVGEWQTRDAFLKELKRPQFNFSDRYDLKPDDFEEAIRNHVKFLTYQGFFDLLFPDVDLEQDPLVLQTLFRNEQLNLDETILSKLENSVFVIDELQRLYSEGTGLNSYGVALASLSKACKEHKIKLLMLSGTLINSDIEELKSLFEIIDPEEYRDIYEENIENFKYENFYPILDHKILVYNPKDLEERDLSVDIRHQGNYDPLKDLGIDYQFKDKALSNFKIMTVENENVPYKSFPSLSTIGDYSEATSFVLNTLKEKLKLKERCVIYSDELKNFGIDLYEHLFTQSGYLAYGNPITSYTLCKNCLKNKSSCMCEVFKPLMFGVLKGEIPLERRNKLVGVYNQPDSPLSLMLISSVAQSGVTLKETNNIFIINTPYSFPKYLQTIYRVIRTDSHINLPKERRFVNVYNMSTPKENIRYKDKISKFIEIDDWERNIYSNIKGTKSFINKKMDIPKITDENKIFHHMVSLDIALLAKRLNINFKDVLRVSEYMKIIRETNSSMFDLSSFTDEELFSLIMLDKNLCLFKLDYSGFNDDAKKIFDKTLIGKDMYCDENELYVKRYKFVPDSDENYFMTINSDDIFAYFKNAEN